jgi:hypothetical protein
VYQERKKQALRSKIKAIGERDNKINPSIYKFNVRIYTVPTKMESFLSMNMEMFNCTVVLNNTIQLNKKIENIIINNGQAS